MPERFVDRQLRHGAGTIHPGKLRRAKAFLVLAALIGLGNTVVNLWVFDGSTRYWTAFGLLSATILYVAVRQHRYLTRHAR